MMTAQQEILKLRPELRYLRVTTATLKRANEALHKRIDSLEEDRKRLKKERNHFKKQKERLEKEIEKIKKQRDTYKGMIFKPNVDKKQSLNQSVNSKSPEKKKVGGQKGHKGNSRKLPEKVDFKKRVFLHHCPDCGGVLGRTDSIDSHTVEDIPYLGEIKTEVTEYQCERQWCGNCAKEVVATPAEVIPNSRLGIFLIIQVLIWKYACRMPIGVMVETLNQSYGLIITTGAVVDILKRAKRWFGVEYQTLLKIIRGSPIKHADETGWRINGLNGWLWAFLTRTEVYYTIEQTRGGGVAKAVLADSKEDDVLVRDDYSAYTNLKLNQQSCWAHLKRVTKEAAEKDNASEEIKVLYQQLMEMFAALQIITSLPFDYKKRLSFYQACQFALTQVVDQTFESEDAKDIQTRIKNQQKTNHNNLLTALLFEDVPLTNNLAERQIRPAVVARKISGGSRSNTGAETFAVNMSVIQTIKLRNQPLIPTLHNLILKGALGKAE